MRVLVAGANGAVGRRLVPMLVANGHRVTGSTTNGDSIAAIRAMGAEPVVVDGLDGVAIGQAVAAAEPEAIVHEMTALSGTPDFRHFDRWFALTNRLTLLAGARFDYSHRTVDDFFLSNGDQSDSQTFQPVTPRFGVRYDVPSIGGSVFANARTLDGWERSDRAWTFANKPAQRGLMLTGAVILPQSHAERGGRVWTRPAVNIF